MATKDKEKAKEIKIDDPDLIEFNQTGDYSKLPKGTIRIAPPYTNAVGATPVVEENTGSNDPARTAKTDAK